MLNSDISDAHKGDRYCTADIKSFYLNNLMNTFRYMKILLEYTTPEIMAEYEIESIISHGYVHVEVQKGTYG